MFGRRMLKTNTRKVINNVMDARVRLLQKALGEPFVMVDARQKLTRQRDAREIIQERRLHSSTYDSILDERASSHHSNVRDRRSTVNQGRYYGVEKRRSSKTFNSELNTFRNDRPIKEIRPMKRNMKISRRPISNGQSMRQPLQRSRHSRINKKPYTRPIETRNWEETSRYSSTPVMRRNTYRRKSNAQSRR